MASVSLGDRQKKYEETSQRYLLRRVSVVIRLDACHFHTWCRGLERPYDNKLACAMEYAVHELCRKISGCRFAYRQSDEISLLLTDYEKLDTEPWFGYRANKVESVAASICTAAFAVGCMKWLPEHVEKKGFATFDARAFNVPADDVCNNFLWRQRDCERNSIFGLARAHFSHKELHGKNTDQMQDMLMLQKKINWNDIPTVQKRGVAFYKAPQTVEGTSGNTTVRNVWVIDTEMPIISRDFDYINHWVFGGPDRLPKKGALVYQPLDTKILFSQIRGVSCA